MNKIVVPAREASLMYGALPAVTPMSSFLEHPAIQQKGSDLFNALLELRKQGLFFGSQ
jgi:hypothetical protein